MEMVMRFSDSSEDVEVLSQLDNGAIEEKLINVKDCAKELLRCSSIEYDLMEINNLDGHVLHYSRRSETERYVIKMPERRIKCTYKGKGYSLVHPTSIFSIDINIKEKVYTRMNAFCIKKYEGGKTILYRYPFPNMLGSNSICTGTISREAADPVEAIMNVIEGNYTHDRTSCKITSTKEFFQAIKKAFPYDILENTGMTLESFITTWR